MHQRHRELHNARELSGHSGGGALGELSPSLLGFVPVALQAGYRLEVGIEDDDAFLASGLSNQRVQRPLCRGDPTARLSIAVVHDEAAQITGHSPAVWARFYARSFGKAQRDEARDRLLEHGFGAFR
jgi:hypothetical protein